MPATTRPAGAAATLAAAQMARATPDGARRTWCRPDRCSRSARQRPACVAGKPVTACSSPLRGLATGSVQPGARHRISIGPDVPVKHRLVGRSDHPLSSNDKVGLRKRARADAGQQYLAPAAPADHRTLRVVGNRSRRSAPFYRIRRSETLFRMMLPRRLESGGQSRFSRCMPVVFRRIGAISFVEAGRPRTPALDLVTWTTIVRAMRDAMRPSILEI